MGFWSKLAGDTAENIYKSTIGVKIKDVGALVTMRPDRLSSQSQANMLTGGLSGLHTGALKAAGKGLKDYQYRNGGKAAEQEMIKSQEAANLSASQQAADEFKRNSSLAASRYAFGGGSGGGSNLQSFTNKGQTKKSILGSF